MKPLPVGSIHGVGPVTAQALQAKGIQTIGDLQNTTLDLAAIVGSFAGTLKERAWGVDELVSSNYRSFESKAGANYTNLCFDIVVFVN